MMLRKMKTNRTIPNKMNLTKVTRQGKHRTSHQSGSESNEMLIGIKFILI